MSEHQQKVAHAQELLKKKRAQKAAAAGSLPTGPAPAGSTPSVAGTSSGEVSGLPDSSQLKFASQYFRRYELILEFKSLRNPSLCPRGIYCYPSNSSWNVWHGVIFVHRGFYRGGVFRFRIDIPDEYPTLAPALRFSSPIFHPLVNQEGVLETAHQFKEWKPSKDHIHHLLSFLHNCFVDTVLGALEEDICADKEAWRCYASNQDEFARRAQACSQTSAAEAMLSDRSTAMDNALQFRELKKHEKDRLSQLHVAFASNESLNNSNEQSIYGKLAMGLLSSLVGGAK